MLTCDTCGSRLRAVVLASNDEGPQEVEYACPVHGVVARWLDRKLVAMRQI